MRLNAWRGYTSGEKGRDERREYESRQDCKRMGWLVGWCAVTTSCPLPLTLFIYVSDASVDATNVARPVARRIYLVHRYFRFYLSYVRHMFNFIHLRKYRWLLLFLYNLGRSIFFFVNDLCIYLF